MRLLILNSSRLTDPLDEWVTQIGRTDPNLGVFPTLTLDEEQAQIQGVSRRHARIVRQPDGYFLEDLGSTNGTHLNRRRLRPGEPAALHDRDEIRLGNIVLRVILEAA